LGKALVPVVTVARKSAASVAIELPNAGFVAHLIATAVQAPQTRLRRRAEPDAAVAAYRALGQWPSASYRLLGRSVSRFS
jgi:hypothetical protein